MHWSFFNNLDLHFWGIFRNWLFGSSVMSKKSQIDWSTWIKFVTYSKCLVINLFVFLLRSPSPLLLPGPSRILLAKSTKSSIRFPMNSRGSCRGGGGRGGGGGRPKRLKSKEPKRDGGREGPPNALWKKSRRKNSASASTYVASVTLAWRARVAVKILLSFIGFFRIVIVWLNLRYSAYKPRNIYQSGSGSDQDFKERPN